VIVSFSFLLLADTSLLEKVVADGRAYNLLGGGELDFDELSETRGVIIFECAGVSERFEERVGGKDLVGEGWGVTRGGTGGGWRALGGG